MFTFDISGTDIAQLSDPKLRELIGLLCEAEFRLRGISTKAILWGGNQDASDGGIDVKVSEQSNGQYDGFVPRGESGFQVKKHKMPKAEIIKEMRPEGALRGSIKDLIKVRGAYIIISAQDSLTQTALKNRKDAMREAVGGELDQEHLFLDFYDQDRIATWVRNFPALLAWVRNQVGRPLKGWQAFANWSHASTGTEEEYITIAGIRVFDTKNPDNGELTSEQGIQLVREKLSALGSAVRIVGLSGVGKTRFAQALFDGRIGSASLNRDQVFYTDISDSPDPDPKSVIDGLIASSSRALVIVDNCPPELHHKLAQACGAPKSTVSLLTIEYDVRDNLPEETDVIRLEPASSEAIQALLSKRFTHIGEVDARTIADFSGGNFRVAIALANTVEPGQTLSGFKNDDLFKRLFTQRHEYSVDLHSSAKVLALLYSFNGEDISSDQSELALLGGLIKKDAADLYKDVQTLRERQLIQSRGVWRAVLPHAIANKLAAQALNDIHPDVINAQIIRKAPERVLKSFTRRLSYLHDSPNALKLVEDWLSPDGWIGVNIPGLNALGFEILRNIAPVSPEKALQAMERAASGEDAAKFISHQPSGYYNYVRLLRHIAYDPKLFSRSVDLICRFALDEDPDEKNSSSRDILKSLFFIYLSGTHASASERAAVIRKLAESDDERSQKLAITLLDAALEAWHFSSSEEFSFGARPRDYGYQPETILDTKKWFSEFMDMAVKLAISNRPVSTDMRECIASNLRGIWTKAGLYDLVEKTCLDILSVWGAWRGGWIAIREIKQYDAAKLKPELLKKLDKLEEQLRPKDLREKISAFVLANMRFSLKLDDSYDDDTDKPWEKTFKIVQQLGKEVAADEALLKEFLPRLLEAPSNHVGAFGGGLALGSKDKKKTWEMLYAAYSIIPAEKRKISLLVSYLAECAESDAVFYEKKLDELVEDKHLARYFPNFQTTSDLDSIALQRLHRSLDSGLSDINYFRYVGYGKRHQHLTDKEIASLLLKIKDKPSGTDVALDILNMRLHLDPGESLQNPEELVVVAQEILSTHTFSRSDRSRNVDDYHLSRVAEFCYRGKENEAAACKLMANIMAAITEGRIYAFDYDKLLCSLAKNQPQAFLDLFLEGKTLKEHQRARIFRADLDVDESPLNHIPDSEIMAWCAAGPESRYALVAGAMQPFLQKEGSAEITWRPCALQILEKMAASLQMEAISNGFASSMIPMGGSGSRADIIERRTSALYQQLLAHPNSVISAWASRQMESVQKLIQHEREYEEKNRRSREEAFE